tara:strand:- start:51 stop:161 length:111 start_codon:yes stop_codon:yes gene_type:complete
MKFKKSTSEKSVENFIGDILATLKAGDILATLKFLD